MCYLLLPDTGVWISFTKPLVCFHQLIIPCMEIFLNSGIITAKMLAEMEVAEQAACQIEGNILENWNQEKTVDSRIREELEKRFGFVYPYEYRKDIPVKVSVSDLKKRSYHEESEVEEAVYFEPDILPLIPRFIEEKAGEKEEYTGVARGTAYHRVMECLEYNKTDTPEEIKEQSLNI